MKKTTVTIGIPVFNEEQSIDAVLRTILDQKLDDIVLEKIIVYSDASTDKTNEIVQSLAKKYPAIKLIQGKERKGKYFIVNKLFALAESDLLVVLDADIGLDDVYFLTKLVKSLQSDPKIVMTAARNILIKPKGFIARVLYSHFLMWDYVKLQIKNYVSAGNFSGAATAYKKEFVHSINIPENLSDPHTYIYLSAKKINGFSYSLDANILENLPATIDDMRRLLNRPVGKRDEMLEKIFGKEFVSEAMYIPKKAKLIGTLKFILADPLYAPFGILISFVIGRLINIDKGNKSPIWEINTSTKKPITYGK